MEDLAPLQLPGVRTPETAPGGNRFPLGRAEEGKRFLLGHFRNVLVAQRYPEVVVLIQEHFLHPRLPDAARLVPRGGPTESIQVPSGLTALGRGASTERVHKPHDV